MKIDGKTRLIGLLGWPISQTKSPVFQNALAKAYGQDFVYLPLPTHPNAVGDAVRGLPALGSLGVNVTVPHKQAVIPFLDQIDSAAAAIGAVNTIVFRRQNQEDYPPQSTGYNTDWIGFKDDLVAHDIYFENRDVLVLGAGGSARAVVYALLKSNCRIHLFARRFEQASALAADMRKFFAQAMIYPKSFSELEETATGASSPLIVNTTPVGMIPNADQSIWPDKLPLPAASEVYDLIYNPAETKLMQQAQNCGCKAVNGLGMLLGQGAEAFRLWTGIKPDMKILEKAVNKPLT
ncbi:MAG: shikimate dehydrogenase [Chloroflexota bacterium]